MRPSPNSNAPRDSTRSALALVAALKLCAGVERLEEAEPAEWLMYQGRPDLNPVLAGSRRATGPDRLTGA